MMKYVSDAGFKYISIGFVDSKLFHGNSWESRIDQLNTLMEKYHLSCVQTHLPCYDLTLSSEITEDKTEEAIKRGIRATVMLGAKWGDMHLRSSFNYNFSESRARTDNKKHIDSYIETAAKCGAGIALENLPVFPDVPKWHLYSTHYEDIVSIADEFPQEHIGICWDFGHAHLAGLAQKQALSYIGNRLKITHIHDNFLKGDDHLIPGTGNSK